MVVGGVPCPPWARAANVEAPGWRDPRSRLWGVAASVVDVVQPQAFLFENVRSILEVDGGRAAEQIRGAFEELGYEADWAVSATSPYLPQQRDRAFLHGVLRSVVGGRPPPLFLPPAPPTGPTLRQRGVVDTAYDRCPELVWTEAERFLWEPGALPSAGYTRVLNLNGIAPTVTLL